MDTPPAAPHTQILDAHEPADLVRAATLLRGGKIVVVPTDTVYGLGASVLKPEAVRRVFSMKGRPPETPVPVLLATAADLPILTPGVPAITWTLINQFWPGALTLVLPARGTVDRTITAGRGTVAVRVPASRTSLRLLEVLGEPIVGTSANRSGDAPFVNGLAAVANLEHQPDAVLLDDEGVTGGVVSTVAELRGDMVVIHRSGAVTLEELRRASGVRVVPVETLADLRQTR